MKIAKTLLATVAAFALACAASAVPINGSIGFAGAFSTDSDSDFTAATEITFPFAISIGEATGTYNSVPMFTPVTFNSFNLTDTGVNPLWSFMSGGSLYSFIATSLSITTLDVDTIVVEGLGYATIDGYEDTAGSWQISANKTGKSFTFSSSASVPDAGTTSTLLGLGLIGLVAVRRFKR